MSLANAFQTGKFARKCPSPARLALQSFNNLFPVETAVFDENLAGMPSSGHHAGEMNARHVALQRSWVQRRLAALRIELHAQTLDELVIGMIPSQREHMPRRQVLLTGPIFDYHFVLGDLFHVRFEQRFHLPRFNAVLNVWSDPILDGCSEIFLAMH